MNALTHRYVPQAQDTMKLSAKLTFVLTLFCAGAAHAQTVTIPPKAQAATQQWLRLMDSADYAATWDQAAGLFKTSVPKADWESAVKEVRDELGAVQSREHKGSELKHSIPGVPDGEYVINQFATGFANAPDSHETVTVRKDEDGVWRVAGYYIQ